MTTSVLHEYAGDLERQKVEKEIKEFQGEVNKMGLGSLVREIQEMVIINPSVLKEYSIANPSYKGKYNLIIKELNRRFPSLD